MDSEEERDNAQELAEEALVRSNYRLSTLYELNQELSALRNVSEALEASLFSIVGVFGLRRGLIALYKGDETQPREFVCSGMQKRTALNHLTLPLVSLSLQTITSGAQRPFSSGSWAPNIRSSAQTLDRSSAMRKGRAGIVLKQA